MYVICLCSTIVMRPMFLSKSLHYLQEYFKLKYKTCGTLAGLLLHCLAVYGTLTCACSWNKKISLLFNSCVYVCSWTVGLLLMNSCAYACSWTAVPMLAHEQQVYCSWTTVLTLAHEQLCLCLLINSWSMFVREQMCLCFLKNNFSHDELCLCVLMNCG
jgi:hypothetical protein